LLRRGAAACAILGFVDEGELSVPVEYMHAHLWLGQALEAKGDKAGACAAYGVVMDRWKDAKPRSVTLEKAKDRSRVMGCPRP
jgi:serine/threonine-protein kinase